MRFSNMGKTAVKKNNLDKIVTRYHDKDTLHDKHIEDACQWFTFPWVLGHLNHRRKVLELGYGEGNFTKELVRNDYHLTLVEGSLSLIEKAKKKYGGAVQCRHSLFEKYQPDKPFDRIVATHVLEHVKDPVLLLKRMKSWLTHDGKIIIIVPNKESIHRRLAVMMGMQPALDTLSPRDKFVGHQRVYSLGTLGRDIRRAGLRIVDSTGFFLKVLPNSMMLHYPIALINTLNEISAVIPKELLANIGVVAKRT